jgi:hypothetical protein
MPVSFSTDIRPLFRDSPDVDSMQGYGLDLASYEEVRARASEVYAVEMPAAGDRHRNRALPVMDEVR